MATAFQANAFQINAFQIDGVVTGTANITERDDTGRGLIFGAVAGKIRIRKRYGARKPARLKDERT